MNENLRAALPGLVPKAIAWAEQTADKISRTGNALDKYGLSIARRVGVIRPELIRIALVDQLPLPSDPKLQQAAIATRLFGPHMAAVTLRPTRCICLLPT